MHHHAIAGVVLAITSCTAPWARGREPEPGALVEHTVSTRPLALAVSPAGTHVAAIERAGAGCVLRVRDPVRLAIELERPVACAATAIAFSPDAGAVAIATPRIALVELSTGIAHELPVEADALAWGASGVVARVADRVVVLDPTTGAVRRAFSRAHARYQLAAGGAWLLEIVTLERGHGEVRLGRTGYVGPRESYHRVATATGARTELAFPARRGRVAIAADGAVVIAATPHVTVYPTSTAAPTQLAVPDLSPRPVLAAAAGGEVVVVLTRDDELRLYDTAARHLIARGDVDPVTALEVGHGLRLYGARDDALVTWAPRHPRAPPRARDHRRPGAAPITPSRAGPGPHR